MPARPYDAKSVRMRDFYLTYHANEKRTPLVAEIGWSHNQVILEKCKDDLEREFYLRMTRRFVISCFEDKAGDKARSILRNEANAGLRGPPAPPSCASHPRFAKRSQRLDSRVASCDSIGERLCRKALSDALHQKAKPRN
jgi:hypothetical protein